MEDVPPANNVEESASVIPPAPNTGVTRLRQMDGSGVEPSTTPLSLDQLKNLIETQFKGGLSSITALAGLKRELANLNFRLQPDAEVWMDQLEEKVRAKITQLPGGDSVDEQPKPGKDQGPREGEKRKTQRNTEEGSPDPSAEAKPKEVAKDSREKPAPQREPEAPKDPGVGEETGTLPVREPPRGTPGIDPVTGRPVVADGSTGKPAPGDQRVEPTSGKGDKFDPMEDYLQRLKRKKDQDTAIVRRITDIETTTTFAPRGEDIDEEALATFADGHGTDVAELEDFAPPAPKPTPRVVPENTDRGPLSGPDLAGLEEKRAAAIREAEEALSDASLSADELQAKLNRLISLASAEELADGDGGDVRIITVPPPPVTVVNNFGPLPASESGGKTQTAALVNGFLEERNRPEAEDGAKQSKRPNAEGDYAEAIPQPGGKRRRAMVLLPPKRRGVLTDAAGAPTATVKTSGGPQGAKISKSLIQGLRDAIAARRGLTRTHGSVLASVPAMARKIGEGAVSATRKLARLYAGSLVPEGPAAPLGAGVTTALSLILLGGLLWATRRRGDTGR